MIAQLRNRGRGLCRALAVLAWFAGDARAEPLEFSRALAQAMPPAVLETSPGIALPALRKGSKGDAVLRLNEALVRAGLTSFSPQPPEVYGAEHEFAVKLMQRHFGLLDDGIAGAILYANLAADAVARNAAVEAFAVRVEQLAHRARSEGRRKMIVVNVPSFMLRAIDLDTGRTVVETPVVVGRRERPTPIGRINVISLKFNPNWNPPPIVLEKDILPRLGKGDAKWFDKHDLVAVGPDGQTRPAHEITQADYDAGWKFTQLPGEDNALGVLKFETDSMDRIYLHDTNERSLFGKANRAQSSGCIRVRDWAALAAFLADTSEEKVMERVEAEQTRWDKVEKVPVFIEYSLGDVSRGKAVLFPDVYAPQPVGPKSR
jgi:murein L,D-transpeptidase YcbB/YkuD